MLIIWRFTIWCFVIVAKRIKHKAYVIRVLTEISFEYIIMRRFKKCMYIKLRKFRLNSYLVSKNCNNKIMFQ